MNVCFRPGTPIHEQQPHASHVLILTNMDQFLLHFLGIIVCYMEKKKKKDCTLCCFISKVLPLHLSKTQSQHGQNNKC